jgi:hypothetical protein
MGVAIKIKEMLIYTYSYIKIEKIMKELDKKQISILREQYVISIVRT